MSLNYSLTLSYSYYPIKDFLLTVNMPQNTAKAISLRITSELFQHLLSDKFQILLTQRCSVLFFNPYIFKKIKVI